MGASKRSCVPVPSLPLRQRNSAATAASRVKCNVHQRNLVGARASTLPEHYMPVFIDESPGKRRPSMDAEGAPRRRGWRPCQIAEGRVMCVCRCRLSTTGGTPSRTAPRVRTGVSGVRVAGDGNSHPPSARRVDCVAAAVVPLPGRLVVRRVVESRSSPGGAHPATAGRTRGLARNAITLVRIAQRAQDS